MRKNRQDTFPDWREKEPAPLSFRSIFKWGAKDQFKHPGPGFWDVIRERLNLFPETFQTPVHPGDQQVYDTQKIILKKEDIDLFEAIVGPDNLEMDTYSRLKFSTGKSMEDILNLRQQKVENICGIVLHPRDRSDIRKIVALCHNRKIPLHVYGGGSSVTLGLACPKGGVALVMNTHMNKVIELNEMNQTITVEPGMMGPVYEDFLNHAPEKLSAAHRYTGGHFPQSFEFSSVGGWVAALGSGQSSSYYGDACDLVISQAYVTPAGEFKTHDFPATATGPKINDIMKGSEGCFGVLVAVTLKIFYHQPQTANPFTFMFPGFESAVEAARKISQAGFGMPSVFRVSDPEETDIALKMYGIEGGMMDKMMRLKGLKPGSRCLMMGRTDGERSFSATLFKQVKQVCKRNQGAYLTGYPMKKWQKGRFSDPYMRDALNDFNVAIDTLEASVTWDHLHDLHTSVTTHIKARPHTICMTHASHFYAQGTNLYFIFITPMPALEEFRKFQRSIIEKIETSFGSLSHHHGVGRMMAPFMEKHLGKEQMDILRAIKNHLDPHHIMNPGGLGL